MNIIGNRKIFLSISSVFLVAAIASIMYFGFRLGVDFQNGSLWQIGVESTNTKEIKEFFEVELKIENPAISIDESGAVYSLVFEQISDADRRANFAKLQEKFGANKVADLDFWSTSPSVSKELRQKAILAVIFVLIFISLYVAWAFRKVSRPVSSWKYGLITLLTLTHDAIIPAGLFAFLGHYYGLVVDTNFIVALLVIIGFSVHDTIVVFDRTRENLLRHYGSENLETIVNRSVNETFTRSINTSLTLVVVLITVFLLGPLSLHYFILTILVGTVIGTYSSIFVASPLLVIAEKLKRQK